MRTHAVALAAMLLLTPLGARAADLVVWWDKGFYAQEDAAVREIVAAFEQETGKQVELAFYPDGGASSQGWRRRTRPGGRPTSPSAMDLRTISRMGARGSAGRPHGRHRQLVEHVRCRRARPGHAARRQDRAAGPVRPADGPLDQPHPRLEEPFGARGLHARRHSPRVGCVLVVLVRPGPAGGAPALGRDDIWGIGLAMSASRRRGSSSSSSWPPTRRIM